MELSIATLLSVEHTQTPCQELRTRRFLDVCAHRFGGEGADWHQSCIARGMKTDSALVYIGTAVRLAGVNPFYTRRVLQRCERGEISLLDAAELLMAAADHSVAKVEVVGVRAPS
jgi:hypothetical protein